MKRKKKCTLTEKTKKELWMSTGGFCQNPECNNFLLKYLGDKKIFIDEFAHIIPQGKLGPRHTEQIGKININSSENIIMLCPTCHRIVDDNADKFTKKKLIEWKLSHQTKIKNMFQIPKVKSVKELIKYGKPYLTKNKEIFNEFGPNSKNAKNPISDAAGMWRRLVIDEIIPNNRIIAALLKNNENLLNKNQKKMLNKFDIHANIFEYNHISGDVNASAPTFPRDVSKFFLE